MRLATLCVLFAVILSAVACAPGRGPTAVPRPTITPVSPSVALPTTTSTIAGPNIDGLQRIPTVNDKGEPVIVYKNAAGKTLAILNPRDPFHNRHIAWDWKQVVSGPDMDVV
ncbi:MAG TPA: hypothetical protein VF932_06760, partial [Anaerolineae bacterium]